MQAKYRGLILWMGATLGAAVLVYGWVLLVYRLNRTFIQANLDALPFQYAVVLGFAQAEWWAFLLSLIVGFLITFLTWATINQ